MLKPSHIFRKMKFSSSTSNEKALYDTSSNRKPLMNKKLEVLKKFSTIFLTSSSSWKKLTRHKLVGKPLERNDGRSWSCCLIRFIAQFESRCHRKFLQKWLRTVRGNAKKKILSENCETISSFYWENFIVNWRWNKNFTIISLYISAINFIFLHSISLSSLKSTSRNVFLIVSSCLSAGSSNVSEYWICYNFIENKLETIDAPSGKWVPNSNKRSCNGSVLWEFVSGFRRTFINPFPINLLIRFWTVYGFK